MIVVQGISAPPSLEGGSVLEREIYKQKQASATPFHYSSQASLRFELRLRAAIVEAAVALHRSGVDFASFTKSRCNEAFWVRTPNGGFELKSGVSPAAAIRDIYANGRLYAFECATAVIIVLYKAVLDTIGADSFDRWFGRLFLHSWHLDSDLRLVTSYNKNEAFPGDLQYFKNPDVDPKHMEWQGENVVVLPDGKYYGHGIGIATAATMVRELNQKRKPGARESAYLMNEATYPDFFDLEAKAGGLPGGSAPPQRHIGAGIGQQAVIVARVGSRTALYG